MCGVLEMRRQDVWVGLDVRHRTGTGRSPRPGAPAPHGRYISSMRTAALLAAAVIIVAAASPARGGAQGADAIDAPRISMPEFKKLIAAHNVVVVDTRNPDEFKAGHMAGALFLP